MAGKNENQPSGMVQGIKLLWIIYCVPGRLLAEYWYLWSKKGQVWQSGRRRKHPFVHFFYSTVIYVVAFLMVSLFTASDTRRTVDIAAARSAVESSHGDNENALPKSDAPKEANQQAVISTTQRDGEEIAPLVSAPAEPPTKVVDDALQTAFRMGTPARVDADGTSGYAVPSEAEAGNDCRTVAFTLDGEAHPSISKTICP